MNPVLDLRIQEIRADEFIPQFVIEIPFTVSRLGQARIFESGQKLICIQSRHRHRFVNRARDIIREALCTSQRRQRRRYAVWCTCEEVIKHAHDERTPFLVDQFIKAFDKPMCSLLTESELLLTNMYAALAASSDENP